MSTPAAPFCVQMNPSSQPPAAPAAIEKFPMSKKSLGYVLVTPDGARWWAGNGTLPVGPLA
jgi:hypothetical protein